MEFTRAFWVFRNLAELGFFYIEWRSIGTFHNFLTFLEWTVTPEVRLSETLLSRIFYFLDIDELFLTQQVIFTIFCKLYRICKNTICWVCSRNFLLSFSGLFEVTKYNRLNPSRGNCYRIWKRLAFKIFKIRKVQNEHFSLLCLKTL